ncbi:MAG: HPr family phosphocarrier protein [Acetivibrio ethanolgignens]
MVSRTFIVNNPEGLHMRPAGVVAKEMGRFSCNVTIVFGDKRINAKSIITIISACIKRGAEVTFECDGEDEEAAMEKIIELESQNFGE